MIDSTTLFNLLSDQTRLRSLMLMLRHDELCVCELTHALDIIQPKASRHLALMRDHELVDTRRDGQWVYYRIAAHLPEWVMTVLNASLQGAVGEPFDSDEGRLLRMGDRLNSRCSTS